MVADINTHWTLNDLSWNRFERAKVDTDILRVVKAASLVQANAHSHADYLCFVFHDDPEFQIAARAWAAEEERHGQALAKWAKLADANFDFDASFMRLAYTIKLPIGARRSVRGTRCGELIARCMVEVGTSSYYAALGEAAEEPVLKEICRHIAADELRHYRTFYAHMKRYQALERLGLWQRLRVAVGRVRGWNDDELAFAYYAGNGARGAYVRKTCHRAYTRRAYRFYRPHHVRRSVAMILKAVGLKPHGNLCGILTQCACRILQFRVRRLRAQSA